MYRYLEKVKIYLLLILPITTVFDAYKLISIGSFDVTISFIFIMIILLLSVLTILKKGLKVNSKFFIGIIMSIFIMINYILSINASINSVFLSCFFIVNCLIIRYEVDENKFNYYINKFVVLITIISTYSIYQFIARVYELPFSDFWIDGYMTRGFNWTNAVYFSTKAIYRSNGIFKEPSFLSQYAAVAILIILINILKKNKKNIINYIMLTINVVTMILTMAGTGIIILGGGIIYIIIKKEHKKKLFKVMLYLIIMLITVAIILDIEPIIKYMIARVDEIRYGTASGGARFTLSFKILKESLENRPIIGQGIGSVSEFLKKLSFSSRATADNNITRIGVELGIIGLVLWTLFQFTLINWKNIKNDYYNILFIFVLLSNITGDNFLSIHIWAFIYCLNVDIGNRYCKRNELRCSKSYE